MNYISLTELSKNLEKYIDLSLSENSVFKIAHNNKSVFLMSEQFYNAILETIFLSKDRAVISDAIDAINTPTSSLIKTAPWEK